MRNNQLELSIWFLELCLTLQVVKQALKSAATNPRNHPPASAHFKNPSIPFKPYWLVAAANADLYV